MSHLRLERERVSRDPRGGRRRRCTRAAEQEIARGRGALRLPERYLRVGRRPAAPRPGQAHRQARRDAARAAAGAGRPDATVGARAARRDPHGPGLRRASWRRSTAAPTRWCCPPSDEGFGLPAVEALACGTPVVACEAPALREVLGERATFVAPGDMRRADRRRPGAPSGPRPPPPAWSWQDAARATWGVYARAMASAEAQRTSGAPCRRRRGRARIDGLEAQ